MTMTTCVCVYNLLFAISVFWQYDDEYHSGALESITSVVLVREDTNDFINILTRSLGPGLSPACGMSKSSTTRGLFTQPLSYR
jgi:hypothetical protein